MHDELRVSGGFGSVRRATWFQNRTSPASEVEHCEVCVAVKELIGVSPQSFPLRTALRFARELRVWRSLEHPNILPCLGFNLDMQRGDAYFVSPYIAGGSIRARLNAILPTANQRKQWIIDLTTGLNYLHTFKDGDQDAPVVHGDLKTANILVNDNNNAMLCDFGLSSIIQEAGTGLTTSDDFKGSIRWCSPELTHNDKRTTSSDVWSWALCVLEIMTRRVPYPVQKNVFEVTMRVAQGPPPSREEYPELPEASAIWAVLDPCLRRDPTSRATIGECWQRITSLGDQDYAILLNEHNDLYHLHVQYRQEAVIDSLSDTITTLDLGQLNSSTVPDVPSKSPILALRPMVNLGGITRPAVSQTVSHTLKDRTVVNRPGRPPPFSSLDTLPPTWTHNVLPPDTFHRYRHGGDKMINLQPRLIVGMDLGMAISGVSYAYLRPSMKPKVRDVVFKGQENELGNTNVPTVLFHDEASNVWYCGVETAGLAREDKSKFVKFEWFKSQLLQNDANGPSESLPCMSSDRKPTTVELFSIFFKYLNNCLKAHFEETEFHGRDILQRMTPETTYVITHPNDWSIWHQYQLKRALIDAGVERSEDGGRVTFLSEGEASLHWWLKEDPLPLGIGSQVVICDAGGGTIDVSSYAVTCVAPLQLTEVKPSDTKVAGAASVTEAFRDHITKKLRESPYGRPDRINRMVEKFETSAKRRFADTQTNLCVDFGFIDDNDERNGIMSGTLSVPGETVGRLFEPSCSAAIEAIRNHASPNCYVVLVGGLSGSPWFFHRVYSALTDITNNVKRASSPRGSAVARGAVDFLLNKRAISRVSRRTFGLSLDVSYDEGLPSHIRWKSKIKIDPVSKRQLLPRRFCPLVFKGEILPESSERRIECIEYEASNDSAHEVAFDIAEYVGQVSDVEFTYSDEANFLYLGDFKAEIPPSAFRRDESASASGGVYWAVTYNIAFVVGQTEIKCYVEWVEEGANKRSLAIPHWKKH